MISKLKIVYLVTLGKVVSTPYNSSQLELFDL
jgi:hypothetical protein